MNNCHVNIYIQTHLCMYTHTYIYIDIFIYIYMYICICICIVPGSLREKVKLSFVCHADLLQRSRGMAGSTAISD
jgi:hypothetical protein